MKRHFKILLALAGLCLPAARAAELYDGRTNVGTGVIDITNDKISFHDVGEAAGSRLKVISPANLRTAMDVLTTTIAAGTYQPLDTDLTTWAGVTSSANGRSLVSAADYAAMRALLDLEAGTDFYSMAAAAAAFQPLDSDLTSISALATTAGGRALLTLADPNADRILFWDDSAGAFTYLSIGSGLSLSGTELSATGGGFDPTTVDATTWSDGANASNLWTFNVSGTDPTLLFGNGIITVGGDLTVTGDLVVEGSAIYDTLAVTGALDVGSLEVGGTTITSTAAELNILDGVTSTAAELNALDGITSTVTELNYTDGVTSAIQTQLDAKAPNAATQTGSHASPSTTNPLAPTWTGPMHSVWYGATGEIDLPAAAGYSGRGLMIYNTGSFTITVDPNGSEVIVRDGTAQTGGVTFTLASGAGNFVALLSDGTRWITLGYKGTLTAGS